MDDEEPVRVRDEDEDVESAVRSVIAQCLQLVAMRDFVDNNRHLIDDLEELQRRTWAHDEWKHSQQQKKALSGGRHAAALQQAGSGNAKSQPRKGTQKDSAPPRFAHPSMSTRSLFHSCAGLALLLAGVRAPFVLSAR